MNVVGAGDAGERVVFWEGRTDLSFSIGFLSAVLQLEGCFPWKLLVLHISLPQITDQIPVQVGTRG